uniref:UDP-glycosyltransferases domain-containing protein n=1 Tax=Heliothis virescens TaxID=7102 RepID=A0A2A4K0I8_HELVI
MEKMKICSVLFSIMLAVADASKILVVFSFPSRSHGILGDGIVRNMLKAGHDVTYITPFEYKNAPANLRQIDVSSNLDLMPSDLTTIKTLMEGNNMRFNIFFMYYMMTELVKSTIQNENVQKILSDPNEKFDLVIAEWMISEVPAGFAAVYDCPFIWISSVEIHWMLLRFIDEASNPAFTVDIMSTFTPPLNFVQRASELWTQVKHSLISYLILDRIQEYTYHTYIGPLIEKRGRKVPEFNDIRYNISMIFSNAYVDTSSALSLPQSHKYIGGYHIDENVKPLPEDLQKLMDGAKNGVIYFSMGSNLKSKDMPDELKASLVKMFGTLKYTVLWKFEEVLPNLPPNLHIIKWAPQQSILAHPNLRLFITHGGLLSTTETVHFGVPIIGIPVFGDQFVNVHRAEKRGFARKVDLSYTMSDELKKTILEVVDDKRYAEKAKELSVIHHDRPVKPGDELIHWVNHVLRTRGAPHLRSPALGVPFYQKMFLDLAVVLTIFLTVAYILLKRAWRFITSTNFPFFQIMEKMKICSVLFSIMLTIADASKILVVYPFPSRSHANLGDGIVRNMLKAGHDVTYITPFEYKNAPATLRQVDVSSLLDLMPADMMTIKSLMEGNDISINVMFMYYMVSEMMKATIQNENVQKVLSDPNEKFDLVIAEWMMSELPAGFAAVYDCPFIWISSVEIHWMLLRFIDEASNPAFTVDIMSTYTPPLNFVQRASELWTQFKHVFLSYVILDRVQEYNYHTYLAPFIEKRGRKVPAFDDIRYNISMIFSNAYVDTSSALSLPQSHKYIGGYHIDENVKPLPEDLQKLMDGAKNGVIYFSMGSNLKSADMPDELKASLVKMFGTLKQTVLWKFEEVLPNLPPNLHIIKWAPQQSILAHPNLRLFITHGGLLSTTEAVHFGVPIVGIPVFGDQFVNVLRAQIRGFARKVDLSYTMTDELKKTILEVVDDKRYAEKAKELSVIHHDRPVKPGDELIHWVNHVLRTRGAPHLRSPALGVPFYQKMFLDLAVVLTIFLTVAYILLKRAWRYYRSGKSKSSKKNN